jgi:hypothetical protein
MYPNIPSHYIHGVCQDAVERISSLRRNRARQYAEEIFDELVKCLNLWEKDLKDKKLVRLLWRKSREIARYQVDLEMSDGILVPRINSASLWLVDDHIWKPVNPTKININSFENTFFTSVAINTHRGWVHLDLEPSKGSTSYWLGVLSRHPTQRSSLIGRIEGRYSTYPSKKRLRSTGLRILLSLLMLMRTL